MKRIIVKNFKIIIIYTSSFTLSAAGKENKLIETPALIPKFAR
jgi:hypothetical protein